MARWLLVVVVVPFDYLVELWSSPSSSSFSTWISIRLALVVVPLVLVVVVVCLHLVVVVVDVSPCYQILLSGLVLPLSILLLL